MKFGICFAQYQDGVQVRESARLVESAGYDSLWVTENVHSGPEALEPMVSPEPVSQRIRSGSR